MRKLLYTVIFCGLGTTGALADLCDYRPSQLIGGEMTGAATVAGSGAAAAGVGLKVAGFYTLTHSVTGLTMLGSAAGGVSAAGTVGIMGGTGAGLGTAAAILMSPVTITVGTVVAIGVGSYEGACYFTDERVTDYEDVLAKLNMVSGIVPDSHFQIKDSDSAEGAILVMRTPAGEPIEYPISNQYIVNGVLFNRDWFLNNALGSIVYAK